MKKINSSSWRFKFIPNETLHVTLLLTCNNLPDPHMHIWHGSDGTRWILDFIAAIKLNNQSAQTNVLLLQLTAWQLLAVGRLHAIFSSWSGGTCYHGLPQTWQQPVPTAIASDSIKQIVRAYVSKATTNWTLTLNNTCNMPAIKADCDSLSLLKLTPIKTINIWGATITCCVN